MEFIDDFLSPNSLSMLEILTYLGEVGDFKLRDKIIYDGYKSIPRERHNFRIFMDDITSDIIDYLSNIDNNIIQMIIDESFIAKNYQNNYAKYFDWKRIKEKDENFKMIKISPDSWKYFVEITKRSGMKIEDAFKVAVIKFLEKRYYIAKKLVFENNNDNIWHIDDKKATVVACSEL